MEKKGKTNRTCGRGRDYITGQQPEACIGKVTLPLLVLLDPACRVMGKRRLQGLPLTSSRTAKFLESVAVGICQRAVAPGLSTTGASSIVLRCQPATGTYSSTAIACTTVRRLAASGLEKFQAGFAPPRDQPVAWPMQPSNLPSSLSVSMKIRLDGLLMRKLGRACGF